MSIMRFTEDHEWIRQETDGSATVGITDHAQDALGDIVFVELPAVGHVFKKGDAACVVESVKAAADLKMPVDGTVLEVNGELAADPARVNTDPLGGGWFMRIRPANPAEIAALMDETAYKALTGE